MQGKISINHHRKIEEKCNFKYQVPRFKKKSLYTSTENTRAIKKIRPKYPHHRENAH